MLPRCLCPQTRSPKDLPPPDSRSTLDPVAGPGPHGGPASLGGELAVEESRPAASLGTLTLRYHIHVSVAPANTPRTCPSSPTSTSTPSSTHPTLAWAAGRTRTRACGPSSGGSGLAGVRGWCTPRCRPCRCLSTTTTLTTNHYDPNDKRRKRYCHNNDSTSNQPGNTFHHQRLLIRRTPAHHFKGLSRLLLCSGSTVLSFFGSI